MYVAELIRYSSPHQNQPSKHPNSFASVLQEHSVATLASSIALFYEQSLYVHTQVGPFNQHESFSF